MRWSSSAAPASIFRLHAYGSSERHGRRAELADPSAAERATGYVIGGISPLGLRRKLGVVLDAGAAARRTIFVSAGRRGLQLELDPADLARMTRATMARIARDF